jgi:hypothetical protein
MGVWRDFANVDVARRCAQTVRNSWAHSNTCVTPHTMFANTTRSALAAVSKRSYICPACLRRARVSQLSEPHRSARVFARGLQTDSQAASQNDTPFRKALKDAAKQQKKDKRATPGDSGSSAKSPDPRLEKWELTVGIEIHAELNESSSQVLPPRSARLRTAMSLSSMSPFLELSPTSRRKRSYLHYAVP